jgi:WXG100 family type VII secretion target
MPPIQVNTDQLYLTARSFWQTSYQLTDQIFELRAVPYRLETAWQGNDAEEFLGELKSLIDQMETQMDELNALGLTLSHKAEAWDECDQRWAGCFRESGT